MKKLHYYITLPITLSILMITVLFQYNVMANPSPPSEVMIDMHHAKNSLDWQGIYHGVLPCASCEGMDTTLRLNHDQTVILTTQYLGKDTQEALIEKGHFTWGKPSTITVTIEDGEKRQYFVGENQLIHLDNEGNRITGELADLYVLTKKLQLAQLIQTQWQLTELNNEKITLKKPPTLIFDDKKIHGFSGCNRFFGNTTRLNDHQIEFGALGSTRMLCEDTMVIENTFHKMLTKVKHYNITDSVLTFYHGEEVIARFQPINTTPMTLENTQWQLSELNGKPITLENAPTLIFGEARKVNGFGGCNNFFGTASKLDDQHIAFTGLGSTMKFCEETMETENAFHNMMNTVEQYAIVENSLIFYQGKTIVARFNTLKPTPQP